MQTFSLFPDYAVLEVGRTEALAMRLSQQLREVDLQILATTSERRTVISRLRREGIADAMALILLTEDEVLAWYNVGPVFLDILRAMRDEVIGAPEQIVARWHQGLRLFVLPDDLDRQCLDGDDDFFGAIIAEDETASYAHSGTHPDTHPDTLASGADPDPLQTIERCLVAAVEMMEHRSDDGPILRRYFLEGASVESIVADYHLASNASLHRIVDTHFCRPLLKGYPVKGIQFSDSLLKMVATVRKRLLYTQADSLAVLERIVPRRFLRIMGLTLLQRTSSESVWMADYIVREGDVVRCRRTHRDLLASLQMRVVGGRENAIRRAIHQYRGSRGGKDDVLFLRALLHSHPCIEIDGKGGYRLVRQRLCYDCVRLARIVYDAHRPMPLADILCEYERTYFERPQTVSITKVRAHFPQVHSVRRGVWEWR